MGRAHLGLKQYDQAREWYNKALKCDPKKETMIKGKLGWLNRAPDKVRISISKIPISSPISMLDHLLESSQRDDSNKWSNIDFGEEIRQVESIEVNFTHLIWSSGSLFYGTNYNGAFTLRA